MRVPAARKGGGVARALASQAVQLPDAYAGNVQLPLASSVSEVPDHNPPHMLT
jgi:hypothetical protein